LYVCVAECLDGVAGWWSHVHRVVSITSHRGSVVHTDRHLVHRWCIYKWQQKVTISGWMLTELGI